MATEVFMKISIRDGMMSEMKEVALDEQEKRAVAQAYAKAEEDRKKAAEQAFKEISEEMGTNQPPIEEVEKRFEEILMQIRPGTGDGIASVIPNTTDPGEPVKIERPRPQQPVTRVQGLSSFVTELENILMTNGWTLAQVAGPDINSGAFTLVVVRSHR